MSVFYKRGISLRARKREGPREKNPGRDEREGSMKLNSVWAMAEVSENILLPVSFEMLARGRALSDTLKTELVALVMGPKMDDAELEKLIHYGGGLCRCG